MNNLFLIKTSQSTIRRFIQLYLGTAPTPYWFHQTLTFKENLKDPVEAHSRLNKFLDSLRKVFPEMGVIYIREEKLRGHHFHLNLLLFGQQPLSPELTRQKLEPVIFALWKRIAGGKVVKEANRLTLQKKSLQGLEYLLKGIKLGKNLPKFRVNWHGTRQKTIIKSNWSKPSKKEVTEAYRAMFYRLPVLPPAKIERPAPPEPFTKKSIKFWRDWFEQRGEDFDTHKRLETGRKISDADYLDWLNAKQLSEFRQKGG